MAYENELDFQAGIEMLGRNLRQGINQQDAEQFEHALWRTGNRSHGRMSVNINWLIQVIRAGISRAS